MRSVPVFIARVLAATGATALLAVVPADAHEELSSVQDPPVPWTSSEHDAPGGAGESIVQPEAVTVEGSGEEIFAPPPTTLDVHQRRVYRRVRPRPRITPPGAYDGYYDFYSDPHPVHYWSPNLPYYDPTHGYNSFRPLPPKSRHYRGPANPHNTGWGVSF